MFREGEFVVSVQIDPPLGANPEALLETAQRRPRLGQGRLRRRERQPAGAGADERADGVGRDRAVHRGRDDPAPDAPRHDGHRASSRCCSAPHAEGVRNILAVTGDPPEAGDYPGSHAVYEVDSIGLVELIAKLNAGEDWNGRAIDAPTSFFPGVAVNPTADDLELELDRFHRKVDAGARFAMTQIVFDLEQLDAFRERLGGTWPIPVLVGVFPIRTHRARPRPQRGAGHRRARARPGALPGRRRGRARGRVGARPRADRRRARTSRAASTWSRRSASRSTSSSCCPSARR